MKLKFEISSYNNGIMAIFLYLKNDELFGDLTINLPGAGVPNYSCSFINSFSSSDKELMDLLKQEKIINKVYGKFQYNMGQYELVEFNVDELRKYDPVGLATYETKFINYDNRFNYYNVDEIKDMILSKNENLVLANDGDMEFFIKYDDIPYFILDYNKNIGLRKLFFSDEVDGFYKPFFETYGDEVSYSRPKYKQIINRKINQIKNSKLEFKDYKVIKADDYDLVMDGLNKKISI